MRVLVTGSNGFVGQHVVKELQQDHEVLTPSSREIDLVSPTVCSGINGGPLQYGYPITNAPLAWTTDGVDALYFYLEQYDIDAIVHLAATCGGIGINKDNPGKFIYENLQMGMNVLEAARLANVSKVVNLGTVCSYPKYTQVPFTEDDLWNGYPEETNAPYGIAKKAIIEMGIAYSRQYGMNVVNLMPANMAGECDNFDEYSSHVIPALIKKFEFIRSTLANCDVVHDVKLPPRNRVTLWGTGSASREFLYAGDCARAIGVALKKNVGPEPINLGTGREITIRDLANMIKRIGGYDAEIIWDDRKPDGQPRRSLDTSRAKNVLKWEAITPLEEIISRTIMWYRDNV
jgi:nucleoside-diphosphate-sugar epimerase